MRLIDADECQKAKQDKLSFDRFIEKMQGI